VRRVVYALIFLSILSAVVVGGHLYLAQRLVFDPDLPEPWRSLVLFGIVALAASLILEPIAQRALPRRLGGVVAWPASLWLGFSFLLLLSMWASELVVWVVGAPAQAAVAGIDPETQAARTRALAVVGFAALVGVAALRGGLRLPDVKRVEIALARWPRELDGFRIVQISDIHIGPILGRDFAREVVRRANALEPDLIAVTGDLADGDVRLLRDEVAPFSALAAPRGVWFVTGNHDYYSGADRWVERARELGMRVLRNERVSIGDGAASFDLAGVEDHHAHLVQPEWREDLDAALAGRDPARPLVLMAHDPSTFRRASQLHVDLQLSGHTHGGQIWPFRYFVRLAVPFVAGLYERNGSKLYVSRGSGFWGPPMRLFSPAEITELILTRAPESSSDP
jgi:predicted MPP superfamily phosphohydrolase